MCFHLHGARYTKKRTANAAIPRKNSKSLQSKRQVPNNKMSSSDLITNTSLPSLFFTETLEFLCRQYTQSYVFVYLEIPMKDQALLCDVLRDKQICPSWHLTLLFNPPHLPRDPKRTITLPFWRALNGSFILQQFRVFKA